MSRDFIHVFILRAKKREREREELLDEVSIILGRKEKSLKASSVKVIFRYVK